MLAHTLRFSPEQDEAFFQELPAAAVVFVLRGDGEPYVSKTANLRRRLQRLLGPPEQSKRLNLRDRVSQVEFSPTGSDFESQFLLYKLLRTTFPKTYAARLRLRPASLVKLHLENEYPRASITTRLGRWGSKNLYYGPFASRNAAEKFTNDVLDFFKMRRCVDDLKPDPSFPGCVYSEMKMCLAPCFKGCTDAEYHAEVARVQAFFDTGGESLNRELSQQRDQASANLAFEEAAATHTKIEKLKPVLAPVPEIVQRIDRLDGIIVQPAAGANAVCLFRFCNTQIGGPIIFSIEQSGEPQSLESRLQAVIANFPAPEACSTSERSEHLAILKRWYYRSRRQGEIFLANEKGEWPLRRLVRGIGRVHRGEKPEQPTEFSLMQLPSSS